MKLLQNIAAASCLIFLSGMNASAQETIKVDDPWKDYPSKKALYNDYSRWSIGINGGVVRYTAVCGLCRQQSRFARL